MKYTDIQKKSESELVELVTATRETLRSERFKDKFTKKASVIRDAKSMIAKALTELSARRRNPSTK